MEHNNKWEKLESHTGCFCAARNCHIPRFPCLGSDRVGYEGDPNFWSLILILILFQNLNLFVQGPTVLGTRGSCSFPSLTCSKHSSGFPPSFFFALSKPPYLFWTKKLTKKARQQQLSKLLWCVEIVCLHIWHPLHLQGAQLHKIQIRWECRLRKIMLMVLGTFSVLQMVTW